MPLTVGDFYSDVRTTIARGAVLDSRLPILARQAVRLLERNNTFEYMRDTYFVIPEEGLNFFDLPTDQFPVLKDVETLAYFGVNGGHIYLDKIDRNAVGVNSWALPNEFYIQNRRLFLLGAKKEDITDYPLLLQTSCYSTWPSDEAEEHPLLDLADDLIKWQIQLTNTVGLRSQEELQGYKLLRDEALRSVLLAQDQADRPSSAQMNYYGGGDGRMFATSREAIDHLLGMYDLPETFGVAGIYSVGG